VTDKKRVLIMHTGGTLGMVGDPLEPGTYAAHLLEAVPEMSQIAYVDLDIVCNLDSSDVGPDQWIELAQRIDKGREDGYDGFVVVHGTDTMAYTASALAFCLSGLDRPVVLTGAQRPLAALRTDARRNLADAVELATRDIPEVGICFDGLLLRGCRTTKSNARDYRAFESPGCEPLARLGVDVDLGAHIRRPALPFDIHPRFDPNVVCVQLTPAIQPAILEAITHAPGLRGLVLVAFGLGTAPTTFYPVADALSEAIGRGLEVIVVSQSLGPVDLALYKNSRALADAGALSGGRLRVEAAVTKLMHALALYPTDRAARRRYLSWNVAGELL
jgi:L-asparaginase